MAKIDEEYALVLEHVDKTVADMARNLLEQEGIPTLLHGPDFDIAELGLAAHSQVRGVGVYVPRTAFDRASEVLAEAWGDLEGEPKEVDEGA